VTAFTIPTIETARLTLRAPRMDDYDSFAGFVGSPRARYIGGPVSDDRSVWRAFAHIAGIWVLRGYGPFVWCLKDGTPIGNGGPWFPRGLPEPEFGWALWSRIHEGKGYASEAMQALIGWTFGALKLPTLVAYIDPENTASIKMALRLGGTFDPDAAAPRDTGMNGAGSTGRAALVYRFAPGNC